jgi:hypothetical protein
MAIPEHVFFSWLVFHDALVTKHKMACWGFLKNWSVFSAMVRLSEETISSSAAALVVIYGGLLWQLVSSLILLFVGMKL